MRFKQGKRSDLSHNCRSAWEANYARYLKFLISKGQIQGYEYEAEEFWFPVKRGTRSYLPDFKVTLPSGQVEYHEVKGYMDAVSKTKLKRMAKYHPHIKIVVIGKAEYNAIKKWSSLIENWE